MFSILLYKYFCCNQPKEILVCTSFVFLSVFHLCLLSFDFCTCFMIVLLFFLRYVLLCLLLLSFIIHNSYFEIEFNCHFFKFVSMSFLVLLFCFMSTVFWYIVNYPHNKNSMLLTIIILPTLATHLYNFAS